jgi:hypothetical protein
MTGQLPSLRGLVLRPTLKAALAGEAFCAALTIGMLSQGWKGPFFQVDGDTIGQSVILFIGLKLLFQPWKGYRAGRTALSILSPPQREAAPSPSVQPDAPPSPSPPPPPAGTLEILAEARRDLATIRTNKAAINDANISAALDSLMGIAESVIQRITEDPTLMPQGRRLLAFHLDRLAEVTHRHATLARHGDAQEFKPRFLETLKLLEGHFTSSLDALSNKDRFDMDVALEALESDLRSRGVD